MSSDTDAVLFSDLGLSEAVVRAVKGLGYESASPIQAATIPAMLEGADILGQAQTGTGRTAAFALPILSMINMKDRVPQALVLVPTRELAIQSAAIAVCGISTSVQPSVATRYQPSRCAMPASRDGLSRNHAAAATSRAPAIIQGLRRIGSSNRPCRIAYFVDRAVW